MYRYCKICKTNKDECDFCMSVLGDKALDYVNGVETEPYEPKATIRGYKPAFAEINDYNNRLKKNADEFAEEYFSDEHKDYAIKKLMYMDAMDAFNAAEYESAYNYFTFLDGFKDSEAYLEKVEPLLQEQRMRMEQARKKAAYEKAMSYLEQTNLKQAKVWFEKAEDYLDSQEKYEILMADTKRNVKLIFGIFFGFVVLIVLAAVFL